MTTPEMLKDEIAYIRTMAEEGHKPAGGGGAIMLTAGLGWGLASVAQAGVFAGMLPASAYWIWYLPMPAFIAVLIMTTQAQRRRPGSTAPVTRAMHTAWGGIGGAMTAVIISFIVFSATTGSAAGWMMMPSVMLALYGAAWSLYASLSKQRWVMVVAAGSFIAAPLSVLLAADPVKSMLGYAGSLLLFVALPGLVMMIRDRRERA